MSLAQVLIAAAAVAGLSIIIGKLVDTSSVSQQNARLLNTATELETRVRAALLSPPALRATREATTVNPELAQCLADTTPSCPSTTGPLIDLELRAPGGVTTAIIPKPTTAHTPTPLDDAGSRCDPATQAGCRWRMLAQWRPRDSAGETIQVVVTLGYERPAANPNEKLIMKPRVIDLDISKTLFKKVDYALCGSCNPATEIMTGFDGKGCPQCSANPAVTQVSNLTSQVAALSQQLNNYSTQITNLTNQITNLTSIVNHAPAAPAATPAAAMPYTKSDTFSYGCSAGACGAVSSTVTADCPGGTAIQTCGLGAGTGGALTTNCTQLGNSCRCTGNGANPGTATVLNCGFGNCMYSGTLVAQAMCK